MTTFAIIGAGNAGCAFAAHLKLLGHETRLYDVIESQLAPLRAADNCIELGGNVTIPGRAGSHTHQARVDYIGDDLAMAIGGAELILCTAPAHAHRAVARELAAHVTAGQIIVLNPGRTCGAIEVAACLREFGAAEGVTVVEAQTLLYACRRQGAAVHVFGLKDRVSCAALPQEDIPRFLRLMQSALPQFVPAEQGIWQTSLDNIGMLFHPTPTLFNLARMETGPSFDYYLEGMSPTIARWSRNWIPSAVRWRPPWGLPFRPLCSGWQRPTERTEIVCSKRCRTMRPIAASKRRNWTAWMPNGAALCG